MVWKVLFFWEKQKMVSFVRGLGLRTIVIALVLLIAVLIYALLGDTNTYKELNKLNTWLNSPVSNIKTIHLLLAIWFITLLAAPNKK